MIIHIEDLRFETIIGILDFERTSPQLVQVNCHIEYTYEDTFINYAHVTELIQKSMHENRFELIETALLTLINEIKQRFSQISSIDLTIKKPDIIDNCIVSVSHKETYL